MNKIILSCALFAAALVGSSAFAEVAPSTCGMEFRVKITSILLVSGGSGTGVVSCTDATGAVVQEVPVKIKIGGIGLGLGRFTMRGVTGNIGITDIREIEGDFAVVQANAGVIGAIGAALGFEGQDNGLSFAASISGGHGIGAMLNGTHWQITLAE